MMDKEEFWYKWFVSAMPKDKQRLADDAWEVSRANRDRELREQKPVTKVVRSPTSHMVLDPESNEIDNYLAIGTKLYAAPVPPPEVRELVEALCLADAALRGANMNMGAVQKKVTAAIAKFLDEK